MLDIAICDDDPTQLSLLASYTEEFIQANAIGAVIHQFDHPDRLLSKCEKQRYHLYILDIVMPMINGLEVGKAIREYDQEAFILYATNEPNFALQSFTTHPINYLIKPIDKQQFYSTLQLVVSKLNLSEEKTCLIKTREGIRVIRYSEILSCEYSKHTVTYTLTRQRCFTTCVIKGTFSQHIEPLLQDSRFIRPHVSYVLNMEHVDSFTKSQFTLRSGQSIPIATNHYEAVRIGYMQYLVAKETERCRT